MWKTSHVYSVAWVNALIETFWKIVAPKDLGETPRKCSHECLFSLLAQPNLMSVMISIFTASTRMIKIIKIEDGT